MIEFERVCLQEKPDLVIVVGDVNSTIACALVAAKLCTPIAHIEAGLRSFDRTMPEAINRILTDQISDYLFTTCEDANQNLIKEGIPENKIFLVGNTMIDTLLSHMEIAKNSIILEKLGLRKNNKIKKYAEEFVNQIRDWIKNNPVAFGINWKCAMDVAIRAANWLVAQEYFSEEGLISDDFWEEFYTSIYEHGKFITKHLENRSEFTNNHYIADLVGLFFIAIYCPFFKESKKWQRFALKELTNEIEKQVYPDGCNFEASTSYHRLALELFFYTGLLAQRAGINLPETYKNQVRKMFEFSLYHRFSRNFNRHRNIRFLPKIHPNLSVYFIPSSH